MVSIGDSFTEGMVDDARHDGRYLGWADRVAHGLAREGRGRRREDRSGDTGVQYANLAIRGRLLDAVVAEQVRPALALGPDLITFHAGANDVLRPGTDLADLGRRYAQAVSQLRGSGAQVVLFTSLARAGGSGRFADRLESRFTAFNDAVRDTAARQGCALVDLHGATALSDRRFWGADRLHLNPRGHARVAAAVLEVLDVRDEAVLGGAPGWWREPLPASPPTRRVQALAADAHWVAVHLIPWIGRRLRRVSSGDRLQPKDPVPRAVAAAIPDGAGRPR
jgi:lysophospholipase L1-like esterase